ncbi:MAG TPA: amidohydrolase [Steroidobacteraceae bacterium]|nr:amidohydrolase [Steroidobacteraceae bacterium]
MARFVAGVVSMVGYGIAVGAAPVPADIVFLRGKIHTEDANRSVVQALAVRGNTIVAVGSDEAIGAFIGPSTRKVDVGGRVVLPGIIDAHTHPAQSAQDLGKCSLDDKVLAPPDIKRRVAKCLKEDPGERDQWFEVTMVNPSNLTLGLADLDSMLADRPLLLSGSDGHTVWVNTPALSLAHITAATQDPAGGHIERDPSGAPTGTLRDNAAEIALAVRPVADLEREASQLEKAFASMRAIGITSVQDAAVDDHTMQIYKRLYDTRRLNMRVRGSFWLKDLHEPATSLIGSASKFSAKWSIDPDFLRADAVKIFADGVIEYPSQTAALLEPYLDAQGHPTHNRGPSYFAQDNLNRIVTAADAAGLTVHIHAIGDRAVRSALDAIADARHHNGALDNRDQIAHLELIEPSDFPRFKALGVIANFQLLWAQRDDYVDKATIKYLGPRRSRYLYPARSLRDAGATIAGGSDWGVSSFNAFAAMEHAITRSAGRGQAALLPEQSLTLQDMVDAYTINAAAALKQEHTTGSLEAGKRGDFIILDRDIFAIGAFDLHNTQVATTYLDGREVYAAAAK